MRWEYLFFKSLHLGLEEIGAFVNRVIHAFEDTWTVGSLNGALCYDVLTFYIMDYPEDPVFYQSLLEPSHSISRKMNPPSRLPWSELIE